MEIISEMETLRDNDKGNATKRIPIIEIARSKSKYSYSEEEEAESDDSNCNRRPTHCPCKTESVVDTSNESKNKYKSSKKIPLQQSMSTGSETSSASVDSWSSGRVGCKLATSLTSVNSDQFTSDAESDNENDLNRVKNQPDELVDNFDKLTLLHVDREHDTELTVPKRNIVIRNLTLETPRRDSNSNYQANDKIGHKTETGESDNYVHRKVGFDEGKTKVDQLEDYTSSSSDESDDDIGYWNSRGKDSSKSSPRYDPYPTERPSSTIPYEQRLLAESPVLESEILATIDPHMLEHYLREVESSLTSVPDECKYHSLEEPTAELEATNEQYFQLNDFHTTWEVRNCVALPLPSDASSDSVDGGQPSPPTYNIPLENDHVQRLSDKFEENLPINGGFSSIFSTDLEIDSFSHDPVYVSSTSLPQPDTRDMNYLPGTASTRNTSMYSNKNHLQYSNVSPQGSGSDIIDRPASDLLPPFEVIHPARQKQPVYVQSVSINSNRSQSNIASSTAQILLCEGIAPTGGSVTVINQNSLNSNSQNSTTTLDSQLKSNEFGKLDKWLMPPSATSSRKVSSASNHIIPIPVRDIQSAPAKRNERQIHPWYKYLRIPETSASKRLHEKLVPGDLEKAGKILLDRKYSLENLLRSPNFEDHSYLMAIVRDPKALACDLKYIIPIVARMKEKNPESLMMRNTRGEDALYLSAIKCPEMPFVAGFLAASIAETSMRDKMTRRTYDEGKNNTLIHALAAKGDTCVNVLLDILALKSSMDVQFDLSAKNNEGKTPLHVAVEVHNPTVTGVTSVNMIQALLQHGADPTVPENRGGDTALHLAISQRRSGIVQALLRAPGNLAVNAQNYDGNTPVHLAAADSEVSIIRQKQICRMLIDAGGRTNIGNNRHQMPVVLVSRSRKEEIKNILHKKL